MSNAVDQQSRSVRERVAARRAYWMADKVCTFCGGTEDLGVSHPTESTVGIFTRAVEHRERVLAEAHVVCRACRAARRVDRERPAPEVACECGCGTMIPSKSRGRPRRFVPGHAQAAAREAARVQREAMMSREEENGHGLLTAECDDGWWGWCSCEWTYGPRRIRRLVEVHHQTHVSETLAAS